MAQDATHVLEAVRKRILTAVDQIECLANVETARLRAMADVWRTDAHRWAERAKRLGPLGAQIRVSASLALLVAWEIDRLVEGRSTAPPPA